MLFAGQSYLPDRLRLDMFCNIWPMKVTTVDLSEEGIIVNFGDGTSTFFAADFLYSHRDDVGNEMLLDATDEGEVVR